MKKTLICLILLVIFLSVVTIQSTRKIWRLELEQVKISLGLTGLGHLSNVENSFGVESLSGLEALYVSATIFDGRIQDPILTEEQLRVLIESKFNQTGIKILTKKENLTTNDKPFLKLMLRYSQRHRRRGPVDYHYSLALQSGQSVRPVRFVLNPELSDLEFSVVTWDYHKSSTCNRDIAVESIRIAVQELLDEFLNDYHKANPNKSY